MIGLDLANSNSFHLGLVPQLHVLHVVSCQDVTFHRLSVFRVVGVLRLGIPVDFHVISLRELFYEVPPVVP